MLNKFYVIPLSVIRLRSAIAILDQNHYRNWDQQYKLVLQAAFAVSDIKNNSIYQVFYDVRAIIHHTVVSIVAINIIYISDKCLNSQIKRLWNKKSLVMVYSYQFPSWVFLAPCKITSLFTPKWKEWS